MTVMAIIPARGGSKRLPKKNLRRLDGRPLIAYSCIVAQAARWINRVVVASDDPEILEATYNYADDCIRLPDDLTTDEATLTGSLKYALEKYMERTGSSADWIALMQPTCPLRQPSLVDKWIMETRSREIDGVLTVDREHYKLGRRVAEFYMPTYVPMTPKALSEPLMRENGVFYLFKASNVLQGYPFTHRMIPVHTPPEQSLSNVDDSFSWDLMQHYYYSYGYKTMFDHLEARDG